MKIVEYKLCMGIRPGFLEDEVNQCLSMGYELYGFPFRGADDWFYQAMVKYAPKLTDKEFQEVRISMARSVINRLRGII